MDAAVAERCILCPEVHQQNARKWLTPASHIYFIRCHVQHLSIHETHESAFPSETEQVYVPPRSGKVAAQIPTRPTSYLLHVPRQPQMGQNTVLVQPEDAKGDASPPTPKTDEDKPVQLSDSADRALDPSL